MNNDLIKEFRNSCFNQMSSLPASMRFQGVHQELLVYLDYQLSEKVGYVFPIEDFEIPKYIPPYQRSNDKWTMEMKVKFIENVLRGVKTNIIICSYGDNEDAIILDGQQRLTAIKEFLTNKFPILDGKYFYKDIKEEVKRLAVTIGFYALNAKDEEEAVKFYIDMNENITHSKEDIIKAKKYLRTLKKKG